ncbi:RNA methyltransferase [Xylaria arbuscula]|nr:RNA methyltransferase [Xylaria arbuscula]
MRLPTTSCLLCRHSVFFKPLNSRRAAAITSHPASSLSAIHNGLRESQKSRPQGFNKSSLSPAKPERTPRNSRFSRDPDWTPPTFKIRRGKKDITDRGPERQSRRSRFNDPTSNFSKRSLVYQMKHGDLKQKMAELEGRPPRNGTFSAPPRRSSSTPMTSDDFMDSFNSILGKQTASSNDGRGRTSPMHGQQSWGRTAYTKTSRDSRTPRDTRTFDSERTQRTNTSASSFQRGDRVGAASRDKRTFDSERTQRTHTAGSNFQRGGRIGAASRDTRTFDSERTRHTNTADSKFQRGSLIDAASRGGHRGSFTNRIEQSSTTREGGEENIREDRQKSQNIDDGPIRIHHTTAASQFLYGRSVVEAALKDSRRQLYKLYLYDGDYRRNKDGDKLLATLAQRKGVDITRVPHGDIRIMDKMSDGRPHNGCILEASPVPQLPLKALGPLSEDPNKPGFHVTVAHQSSEDAQVNGTSDFVSYRLPNGRNPFVLLLDGILDPVNLGAIIRTAAFLGVNGIAITKGNSATLTPVALKASSGASEVMTLFSVSSAVDFLTRSKENGWLVYTAVPAMKRSKRNAHVTVDRVETYDPLSQQPTVLVIGSEGEGLDKKVRREADHEVSIPSSAGGMSYVVDSLNVSVATGILCSAFLKKQSSGMLNVEDPSDSVSASESQLW